MTYTNWVAPLFSAFSLIMTVLNYRSIQRWKRSNKEYEMSRSLYDDYLIKLIPKAYDEYVMSHDWVTAGKEFSTCLKSFRRDIRYFKYSHGKLYRSLLRSLEQIDDSITKGTQVIQFPEQKKDIIDSIANSLDEIYKTFLLDLPNDRIEKHFKS